jgi:hypothetical protein
MRGNFFLMNMKTNVIMERQIGNLTIFQRSKDYMFNATDLVRAYNKDSGSKKELKEYLENKSTKEYIETMALDDEFIIGGKVPIMKSRANKGENAGTWMHPYLFIDLAMWLNPDFKLKVVKMVYDGLIKNRHEAGDNYKVLSSSGVKLKGYNFSEVGYALQWIVFNKTAKNSRQTATQDQLKELAEIETNLAFAIDMGYISSYDQLIKAMRKMWNDKNRKF